jgi:integrase
MTVARQKLGHWIRLVGAETPLATLTPAAFDTYVAQRREEGVSDHTISKEVTHLLSVLRLAKRGGCYPIDIETLRPPDLHAGYVPRKRALTRPELVALLTELPPHRSALVAICVALGCRLGEARRLLPTDIEKERVLIRGTKTKSSQRWVPILSFYRPLLEQARPWLPVEPWGKVWRDMAAACRRAGIDKVTSNDLRRTHSTLLIEAGVDRDVVRRLLGHTTTTMVDRVYGQPTTEALAQLAERKLELALPLLPEYKDVTQSGGGTDTEDSEQPENPISPRSSEDKSSGFLSLTGDIDKPLENAGFSGKQALSDSLSFGETPCEYPALGTRESQFIWALSIAGWELFRAAESLGVVS